ncbi:hypothetical protein OHA72_10280 [Dactylosporangium sp. NBC_01737]|uniref:BTAD domain-containing putative transcriptional regulator n=1 Tax=Dactylosporangium sp. NBC_01737 TaxID=2975959 RepID=UPI002E128AB5|nr:hypothetical protein OHA72_10280 [Dactylosporangium sp. NBC_01737]
MLVGLPVALWALRPVWSELDVAAVVVEPLTPLVALAVLVAGGWLLWAWLIVATVLDIVAVFTQRGSAVRLLPAPLHTKVTTLAGSLLMAVTSVTSGASAVAGVTPPAGATTHSAAPPTGVMPAALTGTDTAAGGQVTDLPWLFVTAATAVTGPAAGGAMADPGAVIAPTGDPYTAPHRFVTVADTGPLTVITAGQRYTVTVRRGDTLWEIAGAWLGDPHRWTEIYHINAGRYDHAGRMRGGEHIEPTWVLDLPDDATPPAGAQPAGPPTHTDPGQTDPGTGPGGAAGPGQTQNQGPGQCAPPSSVSPAVSTPPTSTAEPDDDGVVGLPASSAGTGTPGRTGPTPTPTPTARDANSSAPEGGPNTSTEHGGVSLLSGSWVDLGLALAIIAAVTLVWTHRRRRYLPRPPSARPRTDDPDLTPMPLVVSRLRRGLRRPAPARDDDALDQHVAPRDAEDDGPAERAHAERTDADLVDVDRADVDRADDQDPAAGDDPGGADDEEEDDTDWMAAVGADDDGARDDEHDGEGLVPQPPVVPALTNPVMAVWPPAGLGLTGPRADDAARGFLVGALAAGGAEDIEARTHVVVPSATAATLLGAAAGLPDTPRLTITAGLDEALELLEARTMHRTRLVYRHEVDSVAQLRDADPLEETVEPILLIADADAAAAHVRPRVAALLSQGQRLDIHAVVLGAWPDGDTVVVAADGTTSPAAGGQARHGGHPADIGRLTVLTPAETADLVALLAESHTGHAPPPAPARHPGPTSSAPAEPAQTGHADLHANLHADLNDAAPVAAPIVEHHDTGTSGPGLTDIPAIETEPTATRRIADPGTTSVADPELPTPPDTEPTDGSPTGAPASDEPMEAGPTPALDDSEAAPAPDPVVRVLVLGPPQIVDMNTAKGSARAKSVEVLVYLAVHDGPVHYEPIIDDLLPDAPAKKAPHRLHTYVSALRDVLRRTGAPTEYVPRSGDRYQLNRDVLDVDLWRLQQALRDAEQTTDPAIQVAAWRRAVGLYRGDLAAGMDYEWIEPYREAIRQQILDTVLALADALTDDPTDALTILTATLEHSPYTEALYQAAFRAHAALGDIDAIRALRRTLTHRLAEIDTEPTEETTALANHLLARLKTPPRRTGPHPVTRPGKNAAA